MRVILGEFASSEEAQKAASETMRDLHGLWSWEQLANELAHNSTLDGETIDLIVEQAQREICGQAAEMFGTVDLWRDSQGWTGFQKAWTQWRAAFEKWQCARRKFPMLKGPAVTRYAFAQTLFFASLRLGRGNKAQFYQANAWLLYTAARLGDVGFFKQFAQTKRRKLDPRLVDFHVMILWMPLALWTCQQDAAAKIIGRKTEAWGNNDPDNAGESIRRTCQTLGLRHERAAHRSDKWITGWTKDWKPLFRT
jgi:hypothetical protein